MQKRLYDTVVGRQEVSTLQQRRHREAQASTCWASPSWREGRNRNPGRSVDVAAMRKNVEGRLFSPTEAARYAQKLVRLWRGRQVGVWLVNGET